MEEPKPKSIRSIGLIVSIFSGFIIFSNGMGALAFSIIDFGDELSEQNDFLDFNPIGFLFANYIYMCLIMVTIGVLYLIGGLSVQKYKLWANKLVTYISAILVILIWTFMVVMLRMTAEHEGMELFNIGIIISAVFWSTPIGLLIWFLNQGNIKKHFV